LKLNIPVFVVDDGSTDSTYHQIKDIKGISLLRHEKNRGKGAAIMTGFREAAKIADWGITLDADGQHHPDDIAKLIQGIPDDSHPVIVVGKREGMTHNHVPWTSRFGRRFSNFWVFVSGGPWISDSQSGFRIYPLPDSMNLNVKAKRFQFEVEILVRATRQQIPIIEIPVTVTYDKEKRVSHFRPFMDFLRNSKTFTQLIFERIFFKP
jgi:glycosyltransferase involved in cell wall biosynthesis